MSPRFGPNSEEVERFLTRLVQLTAAEWRQVNATWGRVDATALKTWPKPTWTGAWQSAEAAAGQANLQHAVSRVARAAADAAATTGGSPDATTMAAMALVVRPLINPSTFAILYEPFAAVIPVSDLAA